ncbi:unnamed protein product [Rhizophagus irregularis]|nr:unnamed protein product [Rhizophagus irregularis]
MLKSFQFSDGFESVKEIDGRLIVGIPFSIFLLWIELIFYLRQIPGLCHLEILRILRLKIPLLVIVPDRFYEWCIRKSRY